MILRHLISALKNRLESQPVVAILGPRQCGKSTLAKMIFAELEESVYIDAEKPSDIAKISDPEFFFEQNRSKLICIDEIQRLPEIFQVIRSEVDQQRKPGRFLVLGSASRDLIKQSSETLAGRISYIQLTPFLWNEIDKYDQITHYWNRGGFPNSFLPEKSIESFQWRLDFIQTFLERDIPQFGFTTSSETLRRFWTMLAHTHGQVINLSTLGSSMGVSHTTIRHYIDILSETFMVRQLQPYISNTGKRMIKSPKVYLSDHGVLNALLNITSFNELLSHPIFGASWEGLVIENILGVAHYWTPYFYRTSNGAELDLVLTMGQRVIAIECKASKAPKLTRGFWNAIEDVQPQETWIVAPVNEKYPIKKNVWVLPLLDAMNKIIEIQENAFE